MQKQKSKEHVVYLWQIMEMAAIQILDSDLNLKLKDTDWQHQPAADKKQEAEDCMVMFVLTVSIQAQVPSAQS